MQMAVSALEMPSIRGVGLFEDTKTYRGLHKGVSFAGGADAVIHTAHLQAQPSDNIVYMSTETEADAHSHAEKQKAADTGV